MVESIRRGLKGKEKASCTNVSQLSGRHAKPRVGMAMRIASCVSGLLLMCAQSVGEGDFLRHWSMDRGFN